jgi:hypothetical protein
MTLATKFPAWQCLQISPSYRFNAPHTRWCSIPHRLYFPRISPAPQTLPLNGAQSAPHPQHPATTHHTTPAKRKPQIPKSNSSSPELQVLVCSHKTLNPKPYLGGITKPLRKLHQCGLSLASQSENAHLSKVAQNSKCLRAATKPWTLNPA